MTRSGPHAQSDLARAEADHNAALAECRQAMGWEQEQRARVERCARALHLAEQAVDAMEVPASHVKQASASIGDGPAALGRVEASVRRARAHLETMEQAADEALSHANRASDHLTTATQALREAEDWHQRGQVLAMDTTHDLSEQIRQLEQIDAPISGGGPATPRANETRPATTPPPGPLPAT